MDWQKMGIAVLLMGLLAFSALFLSGWEGIRTIVHYQQFALVILLVFVALALKMGAIEMAVMAVAILAIEFIPFEISCCDSTGEILFVSSGLLYALGTVAATVAYALQTSKFISRNSAQVMIFVGICLAGFALTIALSKNTGFFMCGFNCTLEETALKIIPIVLVSAIAWLSIFLIKVRGLAIASQHKGRRLAK